jgi:hypothetical protein
LPCVALTIAVDSVGTEASCDSAALSELAGRKARTAEGRSVAASAWEVMALVGEVAASAWEVAVFAEGVEPLAGEVAAFAGDALSTAAQVRARYRPHPRRRRLSPPLPW